MLKLPFVREPERHYRAIRGKHSWEYFSIRRTSGHLADSNNTCRTKIWDRQKETLWKYIRNWVVWEELVNFVLESRFLKKCSTHTYCVHRSLWLYLILSRPNPVHILGTYLCKICSDDIMHLFLHKSLSVGLDPAGFVAMILWAFLFSCVSCYNYSLYNLPDSIWE
jgi:hypothetical protein